MFENIVRIKKKKKFSAFFLILLKNSLTGIDLLMSA